MTPLTELQIRELHRYLQDHIGEIWSKTDDPKPFFIMYARAIETAHGIDQ